VLIVAVFWYSGVFHIYETWYRVAVAATIIILSEVFAFIPDLVRMDKMNGVLHPSKIKQVLDGYTIKAIIHGKSTEIRLNYIDCPEIAERGDSQPYARESKEQLIRILSGKRVNIILHKKDAKKRWLAEVFVNGKSANLLMIKKGAAYVSEIHEAPWYYRKFFAQSKRLRLGMHRSEGVSPYIWRKKKEANQDLSLENMTKKQLMERKVLNNG
jgi:endonuclease YncB( thermonuclease family)